MADGASSCLDGLASRVLNVLKMVYKAFVLHIQTVEVQGRGAKPFVRAISHHAEPIAGAYPEQNLADVGSSCGRIRRV